jgi:hypothetical protein
MIVLGDENSQASWSVRSSFDEETSSHKLVSWNDISNVSSRLDSILNIKLPRFVSELPEKGNW